jgi:hypothetical protein
MQGDLLRTTAPPPIAQPPVPSFQLVRSTTVPMTQDLAGRFAKMTPSPTERPLDEKRVKYLRAKIDAGLAVSFQWAFAKYTDDRGQELTYRMNAQHSSTVLNGMNGQFPQGLFAHVDEFKVNSLEALALLFRQYDDRKSSRSVGDVCGAYMGLYPELNDVPRDIGKLGMQAITWFNNRVERLGVPGGDDQFSRFSDRSLWAFFHWLAGINPTSELKIVALVSAMHATYNIDAAAAETFWRQVAEGGIEFETDAPSSALYNWLKGNYEGTLNANIKPDGFFQGAVFCWNAFRASKAVSNVRFEQVRGGFYRISD